MARYDLNEVLKEREAAGRGADAFDGEVHLDDLSRVKVLSPGRQVLKRFLRNRLAVFGFIVLMIMFIFSFLVPLVYPYGQTQIFYKYDTQNINYALAKQGTSYNGYDTAEDIAVLKVNTDQELTVAEFGDSDDLRVGELVVAIGNPLGFDLFGSVTTGIVSALNREVTVNDSTMKLIQHDASINSGNSGGPLINSFGQVIGINSSKMSSSYYSGSSVEGLSFAIPMSHAKDVINDLINKGYVSGKPLIGITTVDVTEEQAQVYGLPVGICIAEVNPGGAADQAGLQKSDIIIAVNDVTVTTGAELNAEKDKYKAGDTITLTIVRQGQDMRVSLTLQEKVPTEN